MVPAVFGILTPLDCLTLVAQLPDHQWATLYPRENRFGPMSPDAWQWLGWQARDPRTGQPICYPLEIYGPVEPYRPNQRA